MKHLVTLKPNEVFPSSNNADVLDMQEFMLFDVIHVGGLIIKKLLFYLSQHRNYMQCCQFGLAFLTLLVGT